MTVEATKDSVYSAVETELIDLGLPEEDISLELRFDEMDLDSLDIADLMSSLKSQFGVNVPRSELSGVTIGGLVERIVSSSS